MGYKAKKTKKDIEKELLLTGSYAPDFCDGDRLVSLRLQNLNNVKRPNILTVVRVIHPLGDGEPSYRLWSEKLGVHQSELCSNIDLKFRKLGSLELAVFMD